MSFVKSTALNVRRPKHFFLNSIFPSLISLACPCNYDILCVLKSNFKCTKYIAKYTFCHTINKLHYCDKNYFIASLHWWIWCEVLFMELKTWIKSYEKTIWNFLGISKEQLWIRDFTNEAVTSLPVLIILLLLPCINDELEALKH